MNQTGTIGIVGGGQLGRMLTEAALPLGFKVIVIDPGENCPAAQAGAMQIRAGMRDGDAIAELATVADYITVESEHVDTEALAKVTKPVNPAPATVAMIQDKFAQKQFLRQNGIPVADFVEITDKDSAEQALQDFGGKMLLKTRHGAFDGRGNALVASPEELKEAFKSLGGKDLYAEKFVPFTRELAVVLARSVSGEIATYPVAQTIHQRNICVEVLMPAPVNQAVTDHATQIALDVANHLEGAGVFAIEMFLTDTGEVLVNEVAPRVHNSGHLTIEACQTSQFEQHVRAITGLELGSTEMKVPAAAMVNVLGERDGDTEPQGVEQAEADSNTKVHLYGKSPTKIDRKMGHITSVGDTVEAAKASAEKARSLISI
jgi:phosphoribosylaminoimidazole carboxylase PurK protein